MKYLTAKEHLVVGGLYEHEMGEFAIFIGVDKFRTSFDFKYRFYLVGPNKIEAWSTTGLQYFHFVE